MRFHRVQRSGPFARLAHSLCAAWPVILAPSLLLLSACALHPREVLETRSAAIDPAAIARLLRRAPVPKGQPLRHEPLTGSEHFSMHLLQFAEGEARHIHRAHDLTFCVHRGTGFVYVQDQKFPAQPGAVFHIPCGVPHYCVNTGPDPLVAVLVFTPPFDGRDTIPLPVEDRSYERDGGAASSAPAGAPSADQSASED